MEEKETSGRLASDDNVDTQAADLRVAMDSLGQLTARTDAIARDLYQEHKKRVYHLCLRLGGGNVAWAEDATQDVFIKLLEQMPGLSDTDDLGGWIYRVTVNTCMTRLKRDGSVWRRVSQAFAMSQPEVVRDTPERQVQVRDELTAALAQLRELPAKERVVFCMRYLDEMPQQQIASTLSLSKGYVSKLLKRVRSRLEQQGWEVPDGN